MDKNYSLVIHDLIDQIDLDLYKNYLNNFAGFDIFYKPELLNNFGINEYLKYFILIKKGRVIALMPFAMRKIIIENEDTGFYDISSFNGYSGPLYSVDSTGTDIIKFWQLVDNWYLNNKVISEFIRFNLEGNHFGYNGQLVPTLKNVKGKIYEDEKRQWNNFIPKVRNNYRKAQKNGLISQIYFENISIENINTFYHIYISTMDRKQAGKSYYFSLDYFYNLISAYSKRCALIIIYKDEVPISTELILLNNEIIYSFLGGTLDSYFNLRPNDFLKIETINWGRSFGFKYYILGGGRSDDDSLYKYKKSFFPEEEDSIYYTGRKILNKEQYFILCEESIRLQNRSCKELNNPNYFPAYRR